MDTFSQTVDQSDLFDDYNNGEESMQTRAQDDLFGDDFTPISEPQPEPEAVPEPAPMQTPAQSTAPATRGRGGAGAARGRGRGRGGNHAAPTRQAREPTTAPPATSEAQPSPSTPGPAPLMESRHAPSPPAGASTEPNRAQPVKADNRPTSVRGDRMATGGNARPKLTEEELSARMASLKVKNATLEAAHARAEADAASFAARENEAAKRRTEERKDRQQMMGEREKNRLRKLKAQQGREWDSEKREEDFADKRRGPGRGAYGGVVGTRTGEGRGGEQGVEGGWEKDYMYREGRGGRGRGGRGGRGDGHRNEGRQSTPQAEDFPALSAARAAAESKAKQTDTAAPVLSFPSKQKDQKPDTDLLKETDTGNEKQSWADMVEEGKIQ
ncbi:hypothetical protein ANO11243_024710 [Dothideomycetidae sp. 11243]|nr:hypothetical protein ANO11243_024710 [fungal sp. No.11243]